ncbi:MAG: 5-formyltetrahydrofolate cyclo-ligase [Planctomycetaceae bacterium]|nr:5-formyltetrahydrofolate cyclo-ligase [Planctomycetaceae bacterium]
MEDCPVTNLVDLKRTVREQARTARRLQPHKDETSRQILARCLSAPEYVSARTVMWYIDVRDEVRTRHGLPDALASGRRVVVPWCAADGELRLFHLQSLDELSRGQFGLLEPQEELRLLAIRSVDPGELDFVLVPGVAFDRRGARLGYGVGYYDRLLANVRTDALLAGLAFECQLVERIPVEPHDVSMTRIVTEAATYEIGDIRSTASID